MSNEFRGHGLALNDSGLAEILDIGKIGAAQLWAVLSVETSGVGFFSDRRPKILYEQHVFSRLTNSIFDEKYSDISNKHPGNYGKTGSHQYDRLNLALSLDRENALMSCSWGIGQTMGFNFKNTKSPDIESMVRRMISSENEQLLCAFGQLIESGAIKALRAKDWVNFARIYNGKNYAINHYDTRLQGAYQKYSYGGAPDLDIRAAQCYLIYLGYNPGAVDGITGKLTRDSLNLFQIKENLTPTPVLNDSTFRRLQDLVTALPV